MYQKVKNSKMRTTKIKVGTIEEWLKEENKDVVELILNNYKDINIIEDWYINELIAFTNDIRENLGMYVNINDIIFTEFTPYGGLTFTGYVNLEEYINKNDKYKELLKYIKENNISKIIRIIRLSSFGLLPENLIVEHIKINEVKYDVLNLITELETELTNTIRELCVLLYETLYKAYSDLTSESSVMKTLLREKYEFNEYGIKM